MKTDYISDYNNLKAEFDISCGQKEVSIDGHKDFSMLNIPFSSRAEYVYPDCGDYGNDYGFPDSGSRKKSGGNAFTSLLRFYMKNSEYSRKLVMGSPEKTDRDFEENRRFMVPVFKPDGENFRRAVILLHGLNEKHWDKYLCWALRLMEQTESPVILFPIAFHMNRAPSSWGSPRDMMRVASERKQLVGDAGETSFLNAALSHRIQFAPHRFFSSGMQTYYDITDFASDVRNGAYPFLARDCRFDFFAYSIGASLAEVITTGGGEHFKDSRSFLFCGGSSLDTAMPVSKTIIDSEAYSELFRWFGSLFDSVSTIGNRVKEIFFQDLPEVLSFKSFLFYDRMQVLRETLLRKNAGKIQSLSLADDLVFPPAVTAATLGGFSGDTGVSVGSMAPPYEYRHEDPFPLLKDVRAEVNDSFNEVFARASDFLNRSA